MMDYIQIESESNTKWGRFRDKLAWGIANWALRNVATTWYRYMISEAITLGIEAAKKNDA